MKDAIKLILAIGCLIAGLASLKTSLTQGLIYIMVGLFLIPPLLNYIEVNLKIKISRPLKYLIVIFGILLGLVVQRSNSNRTTENIDANITNNKEKKIDDKNGSAKNDNSIYSLGKSDNASFKIENKDLSQKPIKATFDLRIEKKINEDQIRNVAKVIMTEYPGFKKYFIFYLLPDMEIGKGAWATSHFGVLHSDSLTVTIQGASSEIEKILKSASVPNGEIIGNWYDASPLVESTITIYKENTQLKVRLLYGDGSSSIKKLTHSGQKYIYPNKFGEFFKIERDGNLGWYSPDGLIVVAKKID